jgi:hypothetical protein
VHQVDLQVQVSKTVELGISAIELGTPLLDQRVESKRYGLVVNALVVLSTNPGGPEDS